MKPAELNMPRKNDEYRDEALEILYEFPETEFEKAWKNW